MIDLDRMLHEIGAWSDTTFPEQTDASIVARIANEAQALIDALHEGGTEPRSVDEEAADIAILLLSLAHRRGFSLVEAIAAKHAINRRRARHQEH